jgi:hypothetical protein
MLCFPSANHLPQVRQQHVPDRSAARLAETRRDGEPAYLDGTLEVRCRFSSPSTEPVLCCRLNSISLGWLRGCEVGWLGGRA